LGDEIKNNKIGGACSMYGEEERSIEGFRGERDYSEDIGADGRIILK
jgi:hypothetical protein